MITQQVLQQGQLQHIGLNGWVHYIRMHTHTFTYQPGKCELPAVQLWAGAGKGLQAYLLLGNSVQAALTKPTAEIQTVVQNITFH